MHARCIASRPSAPLPLTPALESNATALNMQLQNTIVLQRHMVRDCVKTKLFRHLKFLRKTYMAFDLCSGTVCAMIVAYCNVSSADVDKMCRANMRTMCACLQIGATMLLKTFAYVFVVSRMTTFVAMLLPTLTCALMVCQKACVVKSHTS